MSIRTGPPIVAGSGGYTTNYVLDNDSVVQEVRSTQSFATYFNGLRGPECRIDETAVNEGYCVGCGANASMIACSTISGQNCDSVQRGATQWYVYDGMGSVVAQVDRYTNGLHAFDVYGNSRGSSTTSTRHGYVGALGHMTDSETGLVYMRARYYDPLIGRWSSEDPGQNGANSYVYASDNPVNKVDQNGKIAQIVIVIIIIVVTILLIAFLYNGIAIHDWSIPWYLLEMGAAGIGMAVLSAYDLGALGVLIGIAVVLAALVGVVSLLGDLLGYIYRAVRGNTNHASADSDGPPALAAAIGELYAQQGLDAMALANC